MTTDPDHTTTELVRVQNQWKELQSHAKDCASRKKELMEQLHQYMLDTGTGQMSLPDGSILELRTRKSKVPLNQNELTRILTIAFQGDHAQATKVATFILKERGEKETTFLHMEEA